MAQNTNIYAHKITLNDARTVVNVIMINDYEQSAIVYEESSTPKEKIMDYISYIKN